MADRKASNFILLSRSGAKGEDALELLREMRARGVNIAVRTCDISSEDALISVLKQHEHMPPIKGCIQATMVLKVEHSVVPPLFRNHDANAPHRMAYFKTCPKQTSTR